MNPSGLIPGDTLTFTLSFRAIRPATAIVNRVEGHDAVREGGSSGIGADDQDGSNGASGANTILAKELSPPNYTPQAGLARRSSFFHD